MPKTKPTHTPGPWTASQWYQSECDDWMKIQVGAGDLQVATLKARAGTETAQEQYANARLIAAAPELLEIVRQIWLESQDPNGADMPQDIIAGARVAIAKATGQEGR